MAPDGRLVDATASISQTRRFQACGSPFLPRQERRSRSFLVISPFALLTNTQFLHPAPPTLTSTKYAEDLEEVKSVGSKTVSLSDRSDAQTKQAQLSAGVISVTPLNAIWNNVATRHRPGQRIEPR